MIKINDIAIADKIIINSNRFLITWNWKNNEIRIWNYVHACIYIIIYNWPSKFVINRTTIAK